VNYLIIVEFIINNYINEFINVSLFFVIKEYLFKSSLKLLEIFFINITLLTCRDMKKINATI